MVSWNLCQTWHVTKESSCPEFTHVFPLLFQAPLKYLLPFKTSLNSSSGLETSQLTLRCVPKYHLHLSKNTIVRFQSPLSSPLCSYPLFNSTVVKGNRQLLQDAAQFLPDPKCNAEAHKASLSLSLSREMNARNWMHQKGLPWVSRLHINSCVICNSWRTGCFLGTSWPVTGKSLKFVDFHIVFQLILVLICLRISCTTTKKSTNLRLLPMTVYEWKTNHSHYIVNYGQNLFHFLFRPSYTGSSWQAA